MTEPQKDEDFLDRVSARAEEALGKVAEELIANPVVNGAVTRAFEAREKAVQAQVTAMGALNLPSAADIERVTRRLRSLSQRPERLELVAVEALGAVRIGPPCHAEYARCGYAVPGRHAEYCRGLHLDGHGA